ncbi:MAG: hypothetical protein AB8H80_01425 [Planctomycetota bacterium]
MPPANRPDAPYFGGMSGVSAQPSTEQAIAAGGPLRPSHGKSHGKIGSTQWRGFLLALFAAASLLPTAQTQSAEVWASLQLPGSAQPAALQGQGKLVIYDAGSELHVFAATTRSWQTVSKTATTSVRLFNDMVLLTDAGVCRAFSSYSGRFRDVAIQGFASVRNAAGNKNDSIALVAAGNELHAFCAFTGEWTSRPLLSNTSIAVERHIAVLLEGTTTLRGMSAFHGQWLDIAPGAPVQAFAADGSVAFATAATSNQVFAFSAHTNSWSTASHPTLATATAASGDDWALWFENGELLAYSGLRGTFLRAPIDASGTASIAAQSDLFALLLQPNGYVAWSATTGTLLTIPRRAQSIDVGAGNGACALLFDSSGTRGYSALRQSTATAAATFGGSAGSHGVGNNIAYLVDAAGRTHCFSADRAEFVAAPTSTIGLSPAASTATVALNSTASGANDCFAFDAGSGSFVARGSCLLQVAHNPNSAPLLGHDATQLSAFDTRFGVWRNTPRRSAAAPTYRVWRTSALVLDGSFAHAVGAQHGSWSTQVLPPSSASGASSFANSEVAYIAVGGQGAPNTILAASMVPPMLPWQQFPLFRRVQPLGSDLNYSLGLPTNGLAAVAALGPAQPPSALPGLGTLWLDPAPAVLTTVIPTPAEPLSRVRYSLPNNPVLLGEPLVAQALVLTSAGPLLSTPSLVRIW